MSIALRMLPSRLELNSRDGSGMLAPRKNVSFTAFVYVSPVQTIPPCDHTGTPDGFVGLIHLRSSVISGSASRISARMRASASPRHPGPAFGEDVDGAAAVRGLPAFEVLLGFGFAFVDVRARLAGAFIKVAAPRSG